MPVLHKIAKYCEVETFFLLYLVELLGAVDQPVKSVADQDCSYSTENNCPSEKKSISLLVIKCMHFQYHIIYYLNFIKKHKQV